MSIDSTRCVTDLNFTAQLKSITAANHVRDKYPCESRRFNHFLITISDIENSFIII